MYAPTWVAVAFVFVGLSVAGRTYFKGILETVISRFLATFQPGVLPQGKPVSGPKWEFPNGSVIQRFLNGRESSEKWRQYGPVYRLWSGSHPEIVITTPQDFKHFSSDANDHGKPHNMNFGWYLGEILGQCLGFLIGEDWIRVRKTFEPAFTHSSAVSRIDIVDAAANEFVEGLPRLAIEGTKTQDTKGRPFTLSVSEAFTKFPYFLTARTIFGPMTKTEENDLWRLTERRAALNGYCFAGGPYRFATATRLFDRNAIRLLREYEQDWHNYNARLFEARRSRGDHAPIMTYWKEYEEGKISMPELLQTLDELLMLNLDVITHVVTWFITLIADHDHVKQELQEEIAANQDDLLKYIADTNTHLHRCFLESMRVRPFAIFTPGEYSNSVKNFHGVLVKPGTQILLDVLAINVRNPFWGPNGDKFDPSRLKSIKPSELRYNCHSFGIGSRKCMGQYVAGHIVKALVMRLFKAYDVALSDGRQQGGESYGVDKSSWTPKASVALRLVRREEQAVRI